MDFKDYYAILGVDRGAPEKEIKQAYRKLARQHHPDVNPSDKNAEARFREINEAYTVLSDPEKRRRYDELGANWDKVQSGAWSQGSKGHTFQFDPSGRGFQEVFGGGFKGFSDFFKAFFGEGEGPSFFVAEGASPQAYEIEVTLDEAYHGTIKTFTLPIPTRCLRCNGKGVVRRSLCPDCRGQGELTREKRVEVRIPKGIREGQTLRLVPEGTEIFLTVKLLPHRFLKIREDGNLGCTVSVPYLDCVLGGEAEIPTLQGRTVIRIPPGSQNGTTLRLRGLGLPVNGKSGDLLATLHCVLPTQLSPEERKLYEELREISRKPGAKR